MKKEYDEEFHFSADSHKSAETLRSSEEKATDTEKEFDFPSEFGTEYKDGRKFGSSTENNKNNRHRQIKRMMLFPIVSVIAVISLVFSSLGYDPLGDDFMNSESDLQDGITTVAVHVTYMPTGETFTPDSFDDEALADAKAWVESKGGDAETMRYIRSETVFTGVKYSDDLILVGDIDNLPDSYIAQGSVIYTYRRDDYYEAYAAEKSEETADGAFPLLSNLEPDFAGNYAWSGIGSEEYIRFIPQENSPYVYLEMGTAWASFGSYDNDGQFVPNQVSSVPNAVYDAASNTLTLENFTASVLDVNLMGNGFTIRLIGENHLDQLTVWGAYYGGSVTFTGSGSLTVNENGSAPDGVGIRLNGEWSQSCLMVDKDVTLDVYGDSAIVIGATTMEKAIYYLRPLKLTGGTRAVGEFVEYSSSKYDENGNYIGEEPATLDEISEELGVRYYDFSVVDENGNPSSHVRFAPSE